MQHPGQMNPEDMIAALRISTACRKAEQSASKDSLDDLLGTLKASSPDIVKKNQLGILMTLICIISKESAGSEAMTKAVGCMEAVLAQAPVVSDFDVIRLTIEQLKKILFNAKESKLRLEMPEEMHLTSLRIITQLLKNLTNPQQTTMYSVKAAPFLGVLVCICLEEAKESRYRKIKIAAIECLMACGQVLEKPPDENELHNKTAKIFMNFIPGIAKGLQTVINGEETQGHVVTQMAVRAWGRLIAQVMDNPTAAVIDSKGSNRPLSEASTLPELQRTIEGNERNEAYFKMADQSLQGNVEKVCKARSHSHHKVRLELVHSAELILVKCARNLPNCVVPLLEVLVALSEDESSEVARAATKALEAVALTFDEDSSLVEILESNLFRVAESLPTMFNKKEGMNQVTSLSLLVGYLRLLGPRLREALLLHCQVVLDALIFVTTFDCSHIVLLEDISQKGEVTGLERRSWHQHKFFSSHQVEALLKRALRQLALEAGDIIVPQLLATMLERPNCRREAAHLTNLALAAGVDFELARSVVRSYVDPGVWEVRLEADSDTPPAEARANAVLGCILCEGLAAAAASSGPLAAHKLLHLMLYPVLERAGSRVEVVALAGRLALASVADTLGYSSSAALVCGEAHFFTHHVAVRLRRLADNPGALLVLCAVLKHGSPDVLPSIELIIKDVLKRSEDTRFLPNYANVFMALISSIAEWKRDESKTSPVKEKTKREKKGCERSSVVEGLITLSMINEDPVLDSEDEEELGEANMKEQPEEPDQKPPPPLHIQLVETVLLRCLHMLPARNKDIQIMSLRILRKGLMILAPHEDQLLPLVHKIWSPLVQRFTPGQDVVVLRLSFELLCVLASTSRSFIRHRCLEKVLPSVCQFLEKQAQVSLRQRGMAFSQPYKLQKVALDRLGPLAENLELQEEDIYLILKVCSLYLNSDQPQALQESCVQLFRHLTKVNCDAVWLRLTSLWNDQKELLSPSPLCPTIRMPLLPADSNKFKNNVQLLLKEL